MLLPSIALIEVYHPCPWIIPIHKVLFTTNLLLQSICWMKAKLCHCCVTGWCGGHVLQLTHYFLRIVRDKILCQRETPLWKRWRRGWYSSLRLMTASEAWTNFTKAVIFFFSDPLIWLQQGSLSLQGNCQSPLSALAGGQFLWFKLNMETGLEIFYHFIRKVPYTSSEGCAFHIFLCK